MNIQDRINQYQSSQINWEELEIFLLGLGYELVEVETGLFTVERMRRAA